MAAHLLNIRTIDDFDKLSSSVKMVSDIQRQLDEGKNLADVIWDMENENSISKEQIPSMVHTLLIEKHEYSCLSFNLSHSVSEWDTIFEEVKTWDNFHTVIAYYHPQLDVSLINPQTREHWERIESLSAYELMVIFAKARNTELETMTSQFLKDLKAVCSGQTVADSARYKSGRLPQEQAEVKPPESASTDVPDAETRPSAPVEAKESAPQTGKKKRVTPKYAVQVTNELFHNGNVEAWRNIIESYQNKHEGNTVLLYHNGQRIKHISSLFKWGKVKTGDSIYFSIVGEEIKDVAKLKKYLFQGASEDFKYFVKKDVNVALNLF